MIWGNDALAPIPSLALHKLSWSATAYGLGSKTVQPQAAREHSSASTLYVGRSWPCCLELLPYGQRFLLVGPLGLWLRNLLDHVAQIRGEGAWRSHNKVQCQPALLSVAH